MTDYIIWHNPRCSKSRQTLALLQDKGIEPTIVEYLKTPPNKVEIRNALELLGMEPLALMRRSEKIYKEMQLEQFKDKDQLVAAMHDNPILIERPIVFHSGKAAIGRPPENVLKIL